MRNVAQPDSCLLSLWVPVYPALRRVAAQCSIPAVVPQILCCDGFVHSDFLFCSIAGTGSCGGDRWSSTTYHGTTTHHGYRELQLLQHAEFNSCVGSCLSEVGKFMYSLEKGGGGCRCVCCLCRYVWIYTSVLDPHSGAIESVTATRQICQHSVEVEVADVQFLLFNLYSSHRDRVGGIMFVYSCHPRRDPNVYTVLSNYQTISTSE
eukprot:PhF_6_TR19920/c0_g1_i2/m.28967